MEEQKKESGYLVTEIFSELKKQLRILWIAAGFLFLALVGTNIYWIYVFQSYDYVTQDGDGVNYFNSRTEGDVYNGTEDKGEKERQEQGR